MPDKVKISDDLYDQFYTKLKLGIPNIESKGSGGYNATNPSGATGKYQFMPAWLKKYNHSIQQFARESDGLFEVPQTMEDFKNDPNLQEAYFAYYVENVLWPEAKKLIQSNPAGFSLDEIGAIDHFQGYQNAKSQISSGKLSEKTETNVSGDTYLDVYNEGLKQAGTSNISYADTKSDEEKEAIVEDWKEKNQAIDKLKVDPATKERMRADLQTRFYNENKEDIINEWTDNENAIRGEEWDSEVADFKVMNEILNETNFNYTAKDDDTQFINTASTSFIDDATEARWRPTIEKYDKFFTIGTNGQVDVRVDKFLPFMEAAYKRFTDTEVDLVGDDNRTRGKDLSFDVDKLSLLQRNGTRTATPILNISSEVTTAPEKLYGIDTAGRTKPKHVDSKKETTEETTAESEADTTTAQQEQQSSADLTDQFFQTQLGLQSVGQDNLNYTPGKREIPIDAIMGMGMGLIGNSQAKNANIPLRTEDIDAAFKNYMAEMKKMSEHGLPVEVEAEMKRGLIEAYQGGLQNLTQASGGNRALILGNLGQLENAKSEGIISMQLADWEQKQRAYEAYGKALEYSNGVAMRRDIANHGIVWQEEKEKQIRGRELATAGMAKLVDALAYDRENGPGSANDMFRSMMMQRLFGFDPKMRDDGSGTQVGTKSYYEKQGEDLRQARAATERSYESVGRMNKGSRGILNDFLSRNQNPADVASFVNYLSENPGLTADNMSYEQMGEAAETRNWSLLGGARDQIESVSEAPISQGLAQSDLPPITKDSVQKINAPSSVNPAAQAQAKQYGLTGPFMANMPPEGTPNPEPNTPIGIPDPQFGTPLGDLPKSENVRAEDLPKGGIVNYIRQRPR